MSVFSQVPSNFILTSGANSALTWTNAVSVSSMTVSSLGANALTVSTLTTSTSVSASSLVTSSITANSVGYSTLSGSTINATLLNYSSLVGSSISTNAMTLSLTNVSTQNTRIYQVATTNPTTSYTAIQASHVSTGTTNNALALNPSGGNVGVGTTAPYKALHVTGSSAGDVAALVANTNSGLASSASLGFGLWSASGSGTGTSGPAAQISAVCMNASNGSTDLAFNTYTGLATTPNFTLVERMRISAAGGVSIGTSGLSGKLNLATGSTNGATDTLVIGNTNVSPTLAYNIYMGMAGMAGSGVVGSALGDLVIRNDAGGIRFGNGSTANMSITSGGSVGIGTTTPSATLQVNGSLAKSSGTFDIAHPLHPDTNKRLVHSFIEGPRCDLIYRGKTTLVDGSAVVNIDKECTHSPECAMDDGTFEALCDNPQVFLQNNKTFDRVRGVVSGATLTITCESQAAVEIEWMVIAERADPFIKQWDRTNPDGYLVTQYSGDASVPIPPSSGA